jgi:hypothetical protein
MRYLMHQIFRHFSLYSFARRGLEGNKRPQSFYRYRHQYARGWLASNGGLIVPRIRGWREYQVGDFTVQVQKLRNATHAVSATHQLLLIGDAIDTEEYSTAQGEICQNLLNLLSSEDGTQKFHKKAAYLAGRFIIVLSSAGETIIFPDATASISCHSVARGATIWLGSHPKQLAELTAAPVNAALVTFLATARLEKYVVYPPGNQCEYEGMEQLTSNSYYRCTDSDLQQQRFYPFPDTTFDNCDFATFSHHFNNQIKGICEKRRVIISLTGGFDSQAAFEALRRFGDRHVYSWTFVSQDPAHTKDAQAARRVSESAGIRHRALSLIPKVTPRRRAELVATFGTGMQHPTWSASALHFFTQRETELQSMFAEIGNGFIAKRPEFQFTPDNLAALYSSQPRGKSDYAINSMATFMEVATFTKESCEPWSPYDLLYWETRATNWSARRVRELEYSHSVFLPYNSRHVVEAMASVPWDDRVNRTMQKRFVDTLGGNSADEAIQVGSRG